ncbi:hypothetical protein O6H91_15G073500 [Diphasiastrum complanatum]|uniref:Uncharacterized protein n=2 Tax=Diphasiastrum complanatum TaxID=34168 RepID=A0ACC2BJP3_DIPCM|nr:hypothetical protein O6H91_15G073500 [Diphasiastrum complanatum]KAJ7529977.1 hypothetical protein O6H91_15G073500 [Diphasiastrum complanatum]
MAAFAGGKDGAVKETKNSLALILYQENQFALALRGWSEGCLPSSEDGLVLERRDEGGSAGSKMQEVIDLISDEEEMNAKQPESCMQCDSPYPLRSWPEKSSQGNKEMPMDDETREKTEAEDESACRKRPHMNANNSDTPNLEQGWEEGSGPGKREKLSAAENVVENSVQPRFEQITDDGVIDSRIQENGGRKAASGRDFSKNSKNGESAGVIPLADADVLDWKTVNRKESMSDQNSGKRSAERSTKRTVAVKITHSSALAKRSTLPTPLMQKEQVKAESLQEDFAPRETSKKKPRMRGELETRDGVAPVSASPLARNNETVSETVTQATEHSHKLEELPTLLRADGPSQEHEESEARRLVRQTLQKFEALRRKLLRDEEARVKESGNGVKRPDLKAGTIMNANNLWLNRAKKIGAIPGVEVGDQFYFRVELCIVGLHRQIQAGIDSISPKDNQWDVPVAASIIASGGYEDDFDTGETLIYTGQGGNNYGGNKRQQQDQKLERGNLALKHSYKIGVPVRVIRGSKCKDSPTGTIYTYDGLYRVEKFWLERGLSGYGVYKFQLQRLPGQWQTSSALVKFTGTMKSKSGGTEAIIHEDISRGKEGLRICVVNSVDTLTEVPAAFEYGTSVRLPPQLEKGPAPEGCQCVNGCSDPAVCCCIRRNGGQLPYTGDKALVEIKNLVYECGQQCRCPPTCHNRVSQHGAKHRLEIFKKDRGWGVRSWDSIPSGSFVCEYIGQVAVTDKTRKCTEQCDYVLRVDGLNQMIARGVDVSMYLGEPAKNNVSEAVEGTMFLIDAREYGNIARFINHSCSPNLYAQFVLYDHEDLRFPHVMLFAMENTRPFTELTFDYGKDMRPASGAHNT